EKGVARVLRGDADAPPDLDAFRDQRADEARRKMRRAVIRGAAAGRDDELARAQCPDHAAQLARERFVRFDADSSAADVARRDLGIGEHDERMKTADRRAGIGRRLEHAELGGAGAMHGALPFAPPDTFADGSDRVVWHGQENDVGGIDDALRIAARAAGDAGDGVTYAQERERKAPADAALADEAQPLSRDTRD